MVSQVIYAQPTVSQEQSETASYNMSQNTDAEVYLTTQEVEQPEYADGIVVPRLQQTTLCNADLIVCWPPELALSLIHI